MVERNMTEARTALDNASRAAEQVRAASRWFPTYMAIMGVLAFTYILALEVFFPSGWARLAAGIPWVIGMILVSRWAESHDVYPKRANRMVWIAFAAWFGSYLFVIGPIVRWQMDDSLVWWTLASAVMASPFFIGAWWERRRS